MVNIKHVLIVEDSITIARLVKMLLEPEGMLVIHESDGSKVVDVVKDKNIDLVILDLMMPKVSGNQVLAMLKEDADTKKIPVVILSARADAFNFDPGLKACDKFIQKPFENRELVAAIKELLSKK